MLYKELYTLENGFIKTLLNSENQEAINLFSEYTNPDLYISSKIGDRILVKLYDDIVKSDNDISKSRLNIANTILSFNSLNWKRIKAVMSEDYEVFLVADEQYTENVTEKKELEHDNTGTTQNKVNAFDGSTDTNTDKIESSDNGTGSENNTREMTYRKQSTGAMFTPQELLEKEIKLRTNNKFLDLIIKDIKNALCIDIYD